MNILMMTNTYLPHVGGVARSVETFTREYRARGHRVIVVAPEFEGRPADEMDVIRVPAMQNFNGSDFSVRLPIPGFVASQLATFQPDIVHAHHPFLLGENALRLAAADNVPLVFTHHTMYEQYTHYVPGDSPALRRFVVQLTTDFANLCDRVFAPSESVAAIIRDRGVIVADRDRAHGRRYRRIRGRRWRRRAARAGHSGGRVRRRACRAIWRRKRISRFWPMPWRDSSGGGQTLTFWSSAPVPPKKRSGDSSTGTKHVDRLHMPGSRSGQALIDAYHAMDVFAFASQSETQGMVLVEAMAAGVPVVAVDASGVREVVDGSAKWPAIGVAEPPRVW